MGLVNNGDEGVDTWEVLVGTNNGVVIFCLSSQLPTVSSLGKIIHCREPKAQAKEQETRKKKKKNNGRGWRVESWQNDGIMVLSRYGVL